MAQFEIDTEQLNVATVVLLFVFVIALAAVCSIARNTWDCLSCPLRWGCWGLAGVKNCLCGGGDDEYG